MPFTAREIAERIGADVSGDDSVVLNRLLEIEVAGPGDLSFIASKKYERFLGSSKASAVIVGRALSSDRLTLLLHDDPYYAFMLAARLFNPPKVYPPGIHPSAIISESAVVDPSVHIGPLVTIESGVVIGANSVVLANCVIGEGSILGDDCLMYSNVTLYHGCRIGDRVIIHSGTVVGSDGYGYATSEGIHHKIPQVGIVRIENDVEVGANVTIDRAALGETRIGEGTKIDNLVQIAHNVTIGKGCILVAQVGISGSSKLCNYVILGGQVGIAGHLEIGDGTIIAAQSGVSKDIGPGKTLLGSPAREILKAKKTEACVRRLPETLKRLKKLENKVSDLEKD